MQDVEGELLGTLLERGATYSITDTLVARALTDRDRCDEVLDVTVPSLVHNEGLTLQYDFLRKDLFPDAEETDIKAGIESNPAQDDPRDAVAVPRPRISAGIPRVINPLIQVPDNTKTFSTPALLSAPDSVKRSIDISMASDTEIAVSNPKRIILYHHLQAVAQKPMTPWFQCRGCARWPDSLLFDARIESGNLFTASRVLSTQVYELYLNPDHQSCAHMQWFYFCIGNVKKDVRYTFRIRNLIKARSCYGDGAGVLINRPATSPEKGWHRAGLNVCYYPTNMKRQNEVFYDTMEDAYVNPYTVDPAAGDPKKQKRSVSAAKPVRPATAPSGQKGGKKKAGRKKGSRAKSVVRFVAGTHSTLSFDLQFDTDEGRVFVAYTHPYTYTDLNTYLHSIRARPSVSVSAVATDQMGNRTNCVVLGGGAGAGAKELVVIVGRLHPGESSSSFVVQGMLDFLTGRSHDEVSAYIRNQHDYLRRYQAFFDALERVKAEQAEHRERAKFMNDPPPMPTIDDYLADPRNVPAFQSVGYYYMVDQQMRSRRTLTNEEVKALKLRLFEDEQVRSFLLERYTFVVFPMVCTDGVVLGNYRTTVRGDDLNRHWGGVTSLSAPALFAVRTVVDRLIRDRGYRLAFLFDVHGTSKQPNNFLHCNHLVPNQTLKDMFWRLCCTAGAVPTMGADSCASFFMQDGSSILSLIRASKASAQERAQERAPSAKPSADARGKLAGSDGFDKAAISRSAVFGSASLESLLKDDAGYEHLASLFESTFAALVSGGQGHRQGANTFAEYVYSLILRTNAFECGTFDVKACTFSACTNSGSLRAVGLRDYGCINSYTVQASMYGCDTPMPDSLIAELKDGGGSSGAGGSAAAHLRRHMMPSDWLAFGQGLMRGIASYGRGENELATQLVAQIRTRFVAWIKSLLIFCFTGPVGRRPMMAFDMDRLGTNLKIKLKAKYETFTTLEATSGTDFDNVALINKQLNLPKVFDFLHEKGYRDPVSDSDDSTAPVCEPTEKELKQAEKLKPKETRLQEKAAREELRSGVKMLVVSVMNPPREGDDAGKRRKGKKGKKGSRASSAKAPSISAADKAMLERVRAAKAAAAAISATANVNANASAEADARAEAEIEAEAESVRSDHSRMQVISASASNDLTIELAQQAGNATTDQTDSTLHRSTFTGLRGGSSFSITNLE